MLETLIHSLELDRFVVSYPAGQLIFLEGDHTEDLYILVEGEVAVIKGDKEINQIRGEGSVFGEMSSLLGARRTASVRAKDDVRTIKIPKEEMSAVLGRFPELGREICKGLARRLNQSSQVIYGLKQFVDQLPDAVLLTDREGKLLSWNRAAENLYGISDRSPQATGVEDIYVEPEKYRRFLEEVQREYTVTERRLKIRHPEKGIRFISTSTTILYDAHHNFQGVLSLGRDVTSTAKIESGYRRLKFWSIPATLLLVLLAGGFFYRQMLFSEDPLTMDQRKEHFRDQIAKDRLLLSSLLPEPFLGRDRSKTTEVIRNFLAIPAEANHPYKGVVLLNPDRTVFDAVSVDNPNVEKDLVGSSYAGIPFSDDPEAGVSVLSLYRATKEHPIGDKGVEMAFRLVEDDALIGWLVFQMNMDVLQNRYGITEETLRRFRFAG